MNKEHTRTDTRTHFLLEDPRSDVLNPSLSKEGTALFMVGGFRWIKRCSWRGRCEVPLSGCVEFRWHPACVFMFLFKSLSGFLFVCACAQLWSGLGLRPALPPEPDHQGNRIRSFIYLLIGWAFHVLADECVYWWCNENQLWLVSQIIQLY